MKNIAFLLVFFTFNLPLLAGWPLAEQQPDTKWSQTAFERLVGEQPKQPLVIERGQPVAILLPKNASSTMRFAATELETYISRMFGSEVQITDTPPSVAGDDLTIRIDLTEPMHEIDAGPVRSSSRDLANEQTAVVVLNGSRVWILGATDQSRLYGVYRWLEMLGCRWLFPADDGLGEAVPIHERVEIEANAYNWKPRFLTREMGGGAVGASPEAFVDWSVKNGLNRRFALRNVPGWNKRGGMEQWQWIAHNFIWMFPPEENWFERHPEYFALYNGRRLRPGQPGGKSYMGGGNLALQNPDVVEHVANWCIEWFDENPDATVIPLWPNDGAIKWDESPQAMALGGKNDVSGPEASMSNRLVTFANAVAKRVRPKHPDKWLLLPAYASYLEPPDGIKLEPNLFVQLCYHGNYAKSPTHPDNKAAAERMKQWQQLMKDAHGGIVPQNAFGVWEYFLIGDHTIDKPTPILIPLIYRTRDTVRFLHDVGMTRYFTQSNNAWQRHNAILYYSLARLLWNPQQDVDVLIQDFCNAAYGPIAGPLMTSFHINLEKQVQNSQWSPTNYRDVTTPSPLIFTDERVAELNGYLKEAEDTELTEPQRRRLALVREAFDNSVELARTQQLVGLDPKQPWRLERGEDFYIVNADGPDVEPDLYREMARNALDQNRLDENFRKLIFRGYKRKESVVTIENDNLKLSVVPGLGGRAIRLIDKETRHNYFEEKPEADTLDSLGQTYFNYGGYEEYVGHGFAGPGWEKPYRVMVGENLLGPAILVSAVAENWRIDRIYQLQQHQLIVATRLTNTTERTQTMSFRTHPQVTLGGESRDWHVDARQPDGSWQTSTPMAEHDGTSMPVEGLWRLRDPTSGRVLYHAFDHQAANPYFFHGDDGDYAQIELFAKPVELEANASMQIVQKFAVGKEPTAAVSRLDPDRPWDFSAMYASFFVGLSGIDDQSGTCDLLVMPRRIKASQPNDEPIFLFSYGRNDPDWFYLVMENDQLSLVNEQAAQGELIRAGDYVRVSAPLPDGFWDTDGLRRIVVTWDCNAAGFATVRMFVDGEMLKQESALRWPGGGNDGPFALGRSSARTDHPPIDGLVEAGFFTTARDPNTVAAPMLQPPRRLPDQPMDQPLETDLILQDSGLGDQRTDTVEAILRR